MPTIAVDAMSGDRAPAEPVRGVAEVSLQTDIDCLLVGDEARIQAVLDEGPYNPERIAVLHCKDALGRDDDPKEALRLRKDASLLVGLRAVADGRADALVSAGNPGVAILGAARHFELLPGIRRAALAGVLPRHTEYPGQDPLGLLLDTGATVHCEPAELVQFAAMGSAWARRISKIPSPRVGLLNMGKEENRGGEVLIEAHRRLRQQPSLQFVGNVEGDDLVRGTADVIVCEGIVGAVALKLFEGVSAILDDVARAAAERRLMWRVGLRLLSQGVERAQALTDDSRYGGAPLLGFRQLLLTCHHDASAKSIGNAVKVAAKAVRDRVLAEMADALGALR
jgi:glycerol-3-phosphate acyltransferase PlsX